MLLMAETTDTMIMCCTSGRALPSGESSVMWSCRENMALPGGLIQVLVARPTRAEHQNRIHGGDRGKKDEKIRTLTKINQTLILRTYQILSSGSWESQQGHALVSYPKCSWNWLRHRHISPNVLRALYPKSKKIFKCILLIQKCFKWSSTSKNWTVEKLGGQPCKITGR